MIVFHKLRMSHKAAVIVASSAVAACGGGGGGSSASTDSRSINSQNQTQIVAAVMGQLAATDALEQVSGGDETSTALMTRAGKAVARARVARAAVEVPGYCSSGRVLIDTETSTQTYDQCVLSLLDDVSLQLDGTIIIQDFRDDPEAQFDFVHRYAIDIGNRFGNGDLIDVGLNGHSVGNYTDTGEHAETQMSFATSYTCNQQTGDFVGEYDIVSDVTVEGDVTLYSENGQMQFQGGRWIFQGELDIETTEPLRYRDGYNDDYPFEGSYVISAADGSTVSLSFAEGGLYVNERFYTWPQFEEQVVIDDIYASCGEAAS